MFAALGSDDEESEPVPVKETTTSKTERAPPKIEGSRPPPSSRGGRGGERGGERGFGRGGQRGGRGRGGSSRGGYSNEDGKFPCASEWIGLYLAFKERGEVIANRDKDTSETRPRGRGRGARGGGGGGRGREYDRHSATGRVYVLCN